VVFLLLHQQCAEDERKEGERLDDTECGEAFTENRRLLGGGLTPEAAHIPW